MAVVELAREAANRFYGSFGFLIVFVLGFVFAAVGLIMMLFGRGAEASRMAAPTRASGEDAYKGVELDQSLQVNGRSPYQIVSRSPNPWSNSIRVFEGENMWFDPSEYIKSEIEVLFDPSDPTKYVMATTFLPKLAE